MGKSTMSLVSSTQVDGSSCCTQAKTPGVRTWSHPSRGALVAGGDVGVGSDAVHALHPDAELQRKYLKTVHIGALADSSAAALEQDFAKIRQSAEEAGTGRTKDFSPPQKRVEIAPFF